MPVIAVRRMGSEDKGKDKIEMEVEVEEWFVGENAGKEKGGETKCWDEIRYIVRAKNPRVNVVPYRIRMMSQIEKNQLKFRRRCEMCSKR